ncbi:MAG: hypothetical protein K2G78_02495, partial [Muribaculaceae bacterium]|nr:hypothetical protein [Muribaculaceae bacterium]
FRVVEPQRFPEDIPVSVFTVEYDGAVNNATNLWKEDSDWLEYTGDEALAGSLILMDLAGRTIRKSDERKISLAGLPSGILLAIIHLESGQNLCRKILR